MNADQLPDLREALEAGPLTEQQVQELLDLAQAQTVMIQALEKKANLAQTWARAHYHGKRKADQALLESVRRVARDSARLAQNWPKHELEPVLHGKPTRDQKILARQVANGIAQHILNQVKGE